MLAKHSKSFALIDCISVGVDRMQRNFEPVRKQVEAWQRSELTDVTAKVVIYEAFVEGKLEAPKHLASRGPRSLLRADVRGVPATDDLGVFPTHSLRHSRNWIQFPNLRRRPSWASFSNPGSLSPSSRAWRRILLGSDAYEAAEKNDLAKIELGRRWKELSQSTDFPKPGDT